MNKMKKRFLALALVLVLCLSLLPVSAVAAKGDEFEIENGVLVKYNGSGGDVTIPAGVTEIGERAFESCKALTGVTIPDGVTKICKGAFSLCKALTSVTIPDGVKTIEENAFFSTGLTSVKLPNGLKYLNGFSYSKLTSIDIPNGVQTIGTHAFTGCKSLTNITIPDSVQTIEELAFSSSGLTNVTIPDSVQTIGENVFSECNALTSVSIPDSVQVISSGAFSWSHSLTSITIPNSVKSIGGYAFYDCDKLTNIIVPPSVKEIGEYAIGYHLSYNIPPNGDVGAYVYDYGHVTIHGQAGSAAETYAKANNVKFVADWQGETPPPVDPSAQYTDLVPNAWYKDAVNYVLTNGLFQGISDTEFAPESTMNRAMFVVVLARRDGVSDESGTTWYSNDVQWAVSKGYYDGRGPEEAIPRQEMAMMLYRHAGSPKVSGNLNGFTDAAKVSAEARDAMLWAVQNGYIQGMGDNVLNPDGTSTRAQVATVFMRVFG